MFGTDTLSKIKETDPRVYLAVGALSLLKALALRNHDRRSRRELRDAGLFLGMGLVLYQRGGHLDDDDGDDDDENPEEDPNVEEGSSVDEETASLEGDVDFADGSEDGD